MRTLKTRLALTSAVLIAVSVAVTVVHGVSEVQDRVEDLITGSNLGAAQLAATLAEGVTDRERALKATARDWPAGRAYDPASAEDFLLRHPVLDALFNEVRVGSQRELPTGRLGEPLVTAPLPGADGSPQLALTVPLGPGPEAPVLAGLLQLRARNFLSHLAGAAQLDDLHVQTIVFNLRGQVLADADGSGLMRQVETLPGLAEAIQAWRQRGSPLEPMPWTAKYGDVFVAMAAVPGTDWMLLRLASHESLRDQAGQSLRRSVRLGLTVGLVGALATFALTAWLMAPMQTLRRRALAALDPGQPPESGWPQAGGEVGELSDVLKHVSQQLAASRADLERSAQQLQAMLAHAPAGIGFTEGGRIELASAELLRMLGSEGELPHDWRDLLASGASRQALDAAAQAAFAAGQSFEAEIPLRRRNGSTLWARVHGASLSQQPPRAIWIVYDVTEARRQREGLAWEATHDPLTDLVNRREFERLLGQLVADRRRHDAASALFIDLDHFKQVNDRAGHAAGDAILHKVAQVLRGGVRAGDTVARLGGDEFAVLLPGCSLDQALRIAEQIRADVEREGLVPGHAGLGVTASVGVVQVDAGHLTLADVLDAADKACYEAKHSGRNAVKNSPVRTPAPAD